VDAYFDEDSTDPDVQAKVDQWEAVSPRVRQAVTDRLLHLEAEQIETFLSHLAKVALREIDSVVVVPLHGAAFRLNSVPEAISFVEEYDLTASREAVLRYEVEVLYNNGDRIRGEFKDQHDCLDFLRSFSPPPLRPLV
jgi:hypothetical protein